MLAKVLIAVSNSSEGSAIRRSLLEHSEIGKGQIFICPDAETLTNMIDQHKDTICAVIIDKNTIPDDQHPIKVALAKLETSPTVVDTFVLSVDNMGRHTDGGELNRILHRVATLAQRPTHARFVHTPAALENF